MAKPSYADLVAAAETLRSAHVTAELAREAEVEAKGRRMAAEEAVRDAASDYERLTNALIVG